MATRKPKEADANLPFAALQLLAPPVRLVSAAVWKVLKKRDVMQYGVVEEFVTSACESVPGLLTTRHQGKLALGLRGRLILELCRSQADVKAIETHLERIRAPASPSSSSATTARTDVKIVRAVENFRSVIHALLTEPSEKEYFFKEVFPVDYGPKFDEELEKLLWEFLIRLDQLLPVPNLTRTVSWLCEAPTVLEECTRAATQPQLLDILLEHQACLGHLESAASLPPNMGDSILASLSLPPSGRVSSNNPTGGAQPQDKTPFIKPVIGLISNADVPVMNPASKRTPQSGEPANLKDSPHKQPDPKLNSKSTKPKDDEGKDGEEEKNASVRSTRMKRKHPDKRDSESDDEGEDVVGATRCQKMRLPGSRQRKGDQKVDKGKGGGLKTVRNECKKEELSTYMTLVGVKTLPEDPSIRSIVASCLRNQPRVIIKNLSAASVSASMCGTGGKSAYREQPSQRRKSPVKAATHKQTSSRPTPDAELPGLDDKENHPVSPSVSTSSSQQWHNAETTALTGGDDDYVADSEDEATKNFKGRLFMKRYCKTKHGTFVPTLREFLKPGMPRGHLLSAGSKHR
ncbi:TERF1-interacting nuclear factor 2 [Mugil cephalus]|uniref:TERF1-interacting nuclear factor 2 n=1 Tax=Mugil cephalus TaxID=48193 RepID=UPI001FB6946F|nr:TERF1-interacting nuclear factor 2 [Mugil cephalus]